MKYPMFNPIAIDLGWFQVHWYGLMYVFAFFAGYLLARYRLKDKVLQQAGWNKQQLDDLVTYIMLGVILGGRIGYVLFYDRSSFLADPLEIFRIWQGGMSFHGGLLGVLLGIWIWSKRAKHSFLSTVDFIAPLVPPGLLFGRIGNFINAELWGRVTTSDWGMVFPGAGALPRHPSQLYEAVLEGVVLFGILWWYALKNPPTGRVSGVFALFYGVFRFAVEFVREPDGHLGFLALGFSMGQWLCVPLILVGCYLLLIPTGSAPTGSAPAGSAPAGSGTRSRSAASKTKAGSATAGRKHNSRFKRG